MKEIENDMYYQTGIKTSRNEDSVYAMKYASQQMMIDKLQKENQQLKEQLKQREDIINKAKEFIDDYKKQWTLNDDVLDDMADLLKILDNKGDEK